MPENNQIKKQKRYYYFFYFLLVIFFVSLAVFLTKSDWWGGAKVVSRPVAMKDPVVLGEKVNNLPISNEVEVSPVVAEATEIAPVTQPTTELIPSAQAATPKIKKIVPETAVSLVIPKVVPENNISSEFPSFIPVDASSTPSVPAVSTSTATTTLLVATTTQPVTELLPVVYFNFTSPGGPTGPVSPVYSDKTAPTVPILTVINLSSKTGANVSISATSSDESLPLTFSFQFRTSSDWIDLDVDTTSTSLIISGVRGDIYSFRALATDKVGNSSIYCAPTDPVLIFVLDNFAPPAPILDSTFLTIIYTTSTLYNIFGTNSSDTLKVLAYPSSSLESVLLGEANVSSSQWNFTSGLIYGINNFYFVALDEDNNTSTFSDPAQIIFDNQPPSISSFNVSNQSSLTSTMIHLSWAGTDQFSSVVNYDLMYSTSSSWLPLLSGSSSTSFDFYGAHGQTYNFRIRATDGLNNVSAWTTSTPAIVSYTQEIIINELAWAGTETANPNDQWVELYNPGDSAVNLTGWKIMASGVQLSLFTINNNTIPAKGYYLLKRDSDLVIRDTTNGLRADALYSLGGGFKAAGDKLQVIKPDGQVVDQVDCSAGWYAGASVAAAGGTYYPSMERKDPLKNGSSATNWQSNSGPRLTGLTRTNQVLWGSPKRSNYGFIVLDSAQFDTVRTITPENNPYILKGYTVPAGFTLNIQPGVVLKSYINLSQIMVMGGTINALGTTEKPITLTSGRDNNFSDAASTTVGSWVGNAPQPGDWQVVWLRSNANINFDHVNLRYAGYKFQRDPGSAPNQNFVSQAIRADTSVVTINNSLFENNYSTISPEYPTTLLLRLSSSTISNTTFAYGNRAISTEDNGNNPINKLSLNNITYSNYTNSNGPLYITGLWPLLFSTSTYIGNTLNGAYFAGPIVVNSSTAEGVMYWSGVTVNAGAVLNISAGAYIYLEPNAIATIYGTFNIFGTVDKPVNFRQRLSGAANYWGQFSFLNNTETSTWQFANLQNGGYIGGSVPAEKVGMVFLSGSKLQLDNCVLLDTRAPGNVVQAINSTLVANTSTFAQTVKSGNNAGIKVNGGTLTINNSVFRKLTAGVRSTMSTLPIMHMYNMSTSTPTLNFPETDTPVEPIGWWGN